jgi:hypothetical protein
MKGLNIVQITCISAHHVGKYTVNILIGSEKNYHAFHGNVDLVNLGLLLRKK